MLFKCCAILVFATCLAATSAHEVSDKEIIRMIDDIDSDETVPLFGGLNIVRSQQTSRNFESFNNEIADRAVQYLRSHELKFSVPADESEPRSGKLKKIAIPLLLALVFKKAVILPVILTVLTLVSLKALKAGILALLFSGFTLVKDLLAKKDRVTTAYITAPGNGPINAEIVQDWNRNSQEWNRNGQASAQELAYGYHTLPQTV